ncbi:uncharacterized protein EAE98_003533 [Botrytis deweyae]|uniref:Uncharacterized protein n=1 Tax=Botrytis deweyae TaxID=2478750 RepID=A0ABQ7ITV8_9HELO|nr:uncharacterized protein EAE98_003533 [Botrytis deweyae]KAF7933824.1 hypothetical protein EAE98_003533 [Botrytis deweyae]
MTSKSSRPNSRKSDGKSKRSSGVGSKHSEIKPAESDRPRLGSNRSRNERRRSVESLEAKTRDLDIGGRGSPQPPESPGDPIDPYMDPSLRDYEVASKAMEGFKDNKRHDSHKSGGEEEPRRRRRSSRHRDNGRERRSSRSRLIKRTTTTRTTFDKLRFLDREEKVVDEFEYEKSSDNRENDRNLPSSDRRYADSSRRSHRSGEDKRTERKTKEPSLAGSNVSSPKTSVSSEPKSATSSRHSAHTHRSARSAVNDIQAPQAGSHHPSESPSSRKSHKESDDEPKALSEGSASGTLHGRLPRSNTSASDRQSLSERNLNDIYKPDRGGKRTSTTAPSDHGTAERAQTGYGRGDHSNPPYFYEDETKSGISASTSGTTRSSRRTHKS